MTDQIDRPSYVITASLVAIAVLLSLACWWQLLYIVPEFERTFEDFRMRLPYLTERMILASRIAVQFWFFVMPSAFIVLVIVSWVSYVLRHRVGKSSVSTIWFVLLIGLPVAANGAVWLGLWLPYRRLR